MPWATSVAVETTLAALVLVGAFGYAAIRDWVSREVDDHVWLISALAGAVLGALVQLPNGAVPLLFWLLVAAFVVEHVVPWDVPVERLSPTLPGLIEASLYGIIGVTLVIGGLSLGIRAGGVPVEVVAVYLSVVAARALFEFGVLYGGADAKAIMVAGLLVPLFAEPFLPVPGGAAAILAFYPFTLTLLMDAALFAIVVPVGLALRNLLRGDFELAHGFTGFKIPVAELPHRFVWLRDPTFHPDEETNVETSEEDRALRERQARDLAGRGVREVWVTPQLPFIVFLLAGAVAGLLLGNLLFDLFSLA